METDMTREEAIEALKEKLDYYESDKRLKAACETLIPELRESADERTRKWILEYLYDGLRKSDEQFKDQFKSAIAWLERQKENPKSADSISSDCTSDVKCENRWHKVGDSLPDNPREVLCKDEAGNYFIGRYYVGEGWEISNYDDEDKPHHLNPPVSKWIDFPSEKQKEQKHADSEEIFESVDNAFRRGREVGFHEGVESVKQHTDWSEEDEKRVKQLIYDTEFIKAHYEKRKEELGEQFNNALIRDCDEQIAWLKSLCPQPHWKPSKEQMEWLKSAVRLSTDKPNIHGTIISLYEQLKRL